MTTADVLTPLLVGFALIVIAVARLVHRHRHGGPQHRLRHPDRPRSLVRHLIRRKPRC